MISPEVIATYYRRNHAVLHRQCEGLSHEDGLLQPPFRGNCLNWVLGHIVVYRSVALSLIGAEPVWSEEQTAPYARESDPISGEDACPLDKILANLDLAQEQLDEALKVLTQEDMERVIEDHPLGEHLAFYCWHETYHAGQTEYLRQLAGADDKVI